MNTILTVYKKEIKDTLRDKRTLLTAIVLPAIIIPLLLFGTTKLTTSLMKKEADKKLKIVLIGQNDIFTKALADTSFTLLTNFNLIDGKAAIAKDSLDAIIEFMPDFYSKADNLKTGQINVYYKSTSVLLASRLQDKLAVIKNNMLSERIKKMNIPIETLTPFEINKVDIATAKEQIGKLVGGFLPYIFIIFCFLGCMYPAIDLITGEKEKGTMETLLSSPAPRFSILMGKIFAIATIGLSAALMTIMGMLVGLKFMPNLPPDFLATINDMVSIKFIIMLFAMLIPLSLFFAGLLSALVIRAKSFKEAQSIVTPLNFLIIFPALLATFPGVVLNWQTTFVPILNIALATKEIIAGTINMAQYGVIVLSLIAIAFAAAAFSYKQFSKEQMVLN